MEAYLDNSATTRCSKAAAEKMMTVLTRDFGNPSSLHMKGLEAERYIRESRKIIAKSMNLRLPLHLVVRNPTIWLLSELRCRENVMASI